MINGNRIIVVIPAYNAEPALPLSEKQPASALAGA
jgi:hypothetical protein